MENLLLIFLFSLLFSITFIDIVKKDLFFGGVYFFLYVYTVFTQIGYVGFPELSERIKAYFGEQVFYRYFLFVLLSFVFFYLVFLSFRTWFLKESLYEAVRRRSAFQENIFYLLIVSHLAFMAAFFVNNYDLINYANAADQDFVLEQGLGYFLFSMGFKFMVFINLVLYACYRLRLQNTNGLRLILILLLFEIATFLWISNKIGSRTDLMALAIAVSVFEVKLSFTARKMMKIAFFVLIVLALAQFIEFKRGSVPDGTDVPEKILFKDYYPPSHILMAAVAHDYINPVEVFVSDFSNALFKLDHPYLQAVVGEVFNPGVFTRSSSYAFYIFTEGYLALGPLGFIYNGIVVFLGLAVWRSMASSSNSKYNCFVLALISTQMVNIVRSQCSYFVKDIYLFFLPALFLFYLASGFRPSLTRCKNEPRPA